MSDTLFLKIRFVRAPDEIWFPATTDMVREFRMRYAMWQAEGDANHCFTFTSPDRTWSVKFREIASYRIEAPAERKPEP